MRDRNSLPIPSKRFSKYGLPLSLLSLAAFACSLSGQAAPTAGAPMATSSSTSAAVPSSTPSPTAPRRLAATATPTLPPDAILVDTFDQEIAPFKQNGNCSLGEAIQAAQSGKDVDACHVPPGSSTIYLPTGTYSLTEPDSGSPPLPGADGRLGFDPGGFPVIYTRVTIMGNGSTIQRTGANKFPIFQASAQADLTLQNLTVTGGDSSLDPYSGGGALQLFIGKATLDHVTLSGNVSGGDGGAVDIGQGSLASLVLNDSVIAGNTAAANGGGINDDGLLTIRDSTIEGNTAGGVEGGGGIFITENGSASLEHSTIAGNQAWIGGGIFDQGTLSILSGSVISGNTSTESRFTIPTGGGGIATKGNAAHLTIQDSFIIGNFAPKTIAGGISVGVADSSSFTMTGSLVANNTAQDGGGIAGGPGSVTLSCILANQVTEKSKGGLADIDGSLQAGNNWWGHGGQPQVSPQVTTAPLLTQAPSICADAVPTPFPTIVGTPVSP